MDCPVQSACLSIHLNGDAAVVLALLAIFIILAIFLYKENK